MSLSSNVIHGFDGRDILFYMMKIYKLNSMSLIFFGVPQYILSSRDADVAELADALVLGTSANSMQVRVLSSAPKMKKSK